MRAKRPRAGQLTMFPKNNTPFAVTSSARSAQHARLEYSSGSMRLSPSERCEARSFARKRYEYADCQQIRLPPFLVPGGTLPQKLPRPEDLEAFYRLCDARDVTHEAVISPHRQKTLQFLQASDHFVLAIHDATELDYTNHTSLAEDLGQIGNGHHRGYLALNAPSSKNGEQGDEDGLRYRELELPPRRSSATGERHSEHPRPDVAGLARHRSKPAIVHPSGPRIDRRRIH